MLLFIAQLSGRAEALLPLSWESMEGMTPRTSPCNPSVRVSQHSASETLSLCFCSCERNCDKIHVLLQGCLVSNYCDFHLCDAGVLFLRL